MVGAKDVVCLDDRPSNYGRQSYTDESDLTLPTSYPRPSLFLLGGSIMLVNL